MRRLAALALVLLLPTTVRLAPHAHADDAADARRAKIDAAKKAEADERRAFEAKVNAAIDAGVAWLRTKQKSGGNFPAYGDKLPPNTYQPLDLGVNALVLLTLAKSGVPADDKTVDRLKGWCFANYANMKGLKKVMTYPSGVLLMALEALYHPVAKDEQDVKRDRYGTTISRKKTPCKYPGPVAALVEELVKFLKDSLVPKVNGWRYPGNTQGSPEGPVDLSNTQYALLGLDAAARCGSNVPPELYLKVLEYLLATQQKDGLPTELFVQSPDWEPGADGVERWLSAGRRTARGFPYMPGSTDGTTGSMTTAGIACLAIVKARLSEAGRLTPELTRRIDGGILDGLAWLTDVFTVTDNPVVPAGGAPWHYYYLYGVERVGSLTGLAHVAKVDWYRAGAEHLLGAQEKDGGWRRAGAKPGAMADENETEIAQTCFALLFLRRATTPPVVPITPKVLTGGGDDAPADGRGPGAPGGGK